MMCRCRSAFAPILRLLLHSRDGGAALEFAVSVSVFLMFMIGIVEFGRALWTDNALQFAADQAGRYALANPAASDAEITGYATGQLVSVDANRVDVAVTRDVVSGVKFVTITATYAFAPAAALVPVATIALTGRARVPLSS